MDVYFASARVAQLLQSQKERTRQYGPQNAKLIVQRLDNLRFAADLEQVLKLPGHLHELTGDRAGALAMRLQGGMRLILKPVDEPPPRKPDGGLDLKAIRAVVIVGVEDYHD